MADLAHYYISATRKVGDKIMPAMPPIMLDAALILIFNDLTCTTVGKKSNITFVPQKIEYLGGHGNFGVWRTYGSKKYFDKAKQAIVGMSSVPDVPDYPFSLETFYKYHEKYLQAACKLARAKPNVDSLLEKIKALDLSKHPIFFDEVRDNYLDIFRLPNDAFVPWYAPYIMNAGTLAYDINQEALKSIKDYLDAQPKTSEVHIMNQLYGGALCAYMFTNIRPNISEDKAVRVFTEPTLQN